MLQEFFNNVVEEHKNKTSSDELNKTIKKAYEKTLLPFHGWLLQKTFSVSALNLGGRGRGGGSGSRESNVLFQLKIQHNYEVQLALICLRFHLIN